jgi:hypothetical protein
MIPLGEYRGDLRAIGVGGGRTVRHGSKPIWIRRIIEHDRAPGHAGNMRLIRTFRLIRVKRKSA